jgi:hypothetical protein
MMRAVASLILAIWASAAFGDEAFQVPQGYTLQILEPTGGKIARPNGWFYMESKGPAWTISREDPAKGWFRVGMTIRVAGNFKQLGISSGSFIDQVVAQQKQKAAKVVAECPTSKQGMFLRRCLETEEIWPIDGKPLRLHMQYALFWLDGGDLAVIATFLAPVEEWENARQYAKVMGAFELIDMSRFPKKTQP